MRIDTRPRHKMPPQRSSQARERFSSAIRSSKRRPTYRELADAIGATEGQLKMWVNRNEFDRDAALRIARILGLASTTSDLQAKYSFEELTLRRVLRPQRS